MMTDYDDAVRTIIDLPDDQLDALFDTNILIDYLNGVEPARTEIARAHERFVPYSL